MPNRSTLRRGLVMAAVLLVVLVILELVGVTDLGYGFAIIFTVVFSIVWTLLDHVRSRRDT